MQVGDNKMYSYIKEMSGRVSVFAGTAILTCIIVALSETITFIYLLFTHVTNLTNALVLGALVPAFLCPPVYAVILITLRKLNEAQRERDLSIQRLQTEKTRKETIIVDLKEALAKVKRLSGLLPICSHCKKIRNDKGYWDQIEKYISEHSDAMFSHGVCPNCMDKYYSEFLKC